MRQLRYHNVVDVEIPTWSKRESGWHCSKVSLPKKLSKKAGQLGAVKLLPMVESNGLGNGVSPVGVAVWIVSPLVVDVVADDVTVFDADAMLADKLVAVSCRACNCIALVGGSLLSNMSSAHPSRCSAV